jgi:hypothetical protein
MNTYSIASTVYVSRSGVHDHESLQPHSPDKLSYRDSLTFSRFHPRFLFIKKLRTSKEEIYETTYTEVIIATHQRIRTNTAI